MFDLTDILKSVQSTELLKFNLDRKVTKEFDALWDRCFEKKEEFKNKSNKVSVQISDFIDWFDKEIKPTFTKLMVSEFGITLKEVTYDPSFYMRVDGKDVYKFINALYAAQGKNVMRKKLVPLCEQFKQSLDLDAGVIKMNKLPMDIKFSINLDINSSFFNHELGVINTKPMTSQEITSIILHEIGHMFTMIYTASHIGHIGAFNSATLKHAITTARTASPEELKKEASDFAVYVNRVAPNEVDSSFVKTLIARMDAGDTTAIIIRILYVIIVIHSTTRFLNTVISTLLITRIANRYTLFVPAGASSQTVTNKAGNQLERLADEFVASFGYSQYLNTGLDKYITIMTVTYPAIIADGFKTESEILKPLTMLFAIVMMTESTMNHILSRIGGKDRTVYEDNVTRSKRNIANMYNILNHDTKLTASEKKKVVEIIEQMRSDNTLSLINKVTDSVIMLLDIALSNIKMPIYAVVDTLTDANMRGELEIILNDVEELINNPLTYQSSRIGSIGK